MLRADVGRCLAILRLARGWSQSRLSEISGVTPSAISDYERGKIDPQATTLFRLLQSLGAPAHLLDQTRDFLTFVRTIMEGVDDLPSKAPTINEGLAQLPPEVAAEIGAIAAEAARSQARTTRMQLGLLAQLVYASGQSV